MSLRWLCSALQPHSWGENGLFRALFKVKIKSAVILQPALQPRLKPKPVSIVTTRFCRSLEVGAVRSLRKHCVRTGLVAQAGSLPDIAEHLTQIRWRFRRVSSVQKPQTCKRILVNKLPIVFLIAPVKQ